LFLGFSGFLMEKPEKDDFPKIAWSAKALEKVWDDGSDRIWESYL
jgi:hypothetical protein